MNVPITKRTFVPLGTIAFARTTVEEFDGRRVTELAQQTKLSQSGPVHLRMMHTVDYSFTRALLVHPCFPNAIDAIAEDDLRSLSLRYNSARNRVKITHRPIICRS